MCWMGKHQIFWETETQTTHKSYLIGKWNGGLKILLYSLFTILIDVPLIWPKKTKWQKIYCWFSTSGCPEISKTQNFELSYYCWDIGLMCAPSNWNEGARLVKTSNSGQSDYVTATLVACQTRLPYEEPYPTRRLFLQFTAVPSSWRRHIADI